MRIVIITNPTAFQWSPLDCDAWGGGEEGAALLSRAMAKRGHDVTVIYDGPAIADVTAIGDVGGRWVPRGSATPAPFDVAIYRKCPELYEPSLAPVQFLWMDHTRPADFSPFRRIILMSPYLRRMQQAAFPITAGKLEVIPDGYDPTMLLGGDVTRDPNLVLHASSPDRGLVDLLKLWPDVVAARPMARLHISYGWDLFTACGGDPALRAEVERLITRPEMGSVEMHRSTYADIHRLFRQAGVWAYYCTGGEGFCQTAVKAQMAGAVPVVRPWGALHDTVWSGLKATGPASFTAALIEALDPVRQEALRSQIAPMAPDWDTVAAHWEHLLTSTDPAPAITSRIVQVPATPDGLLPNPSLNVPGALQQLLGTWAQAVGATRPWVEPSLAVAFPPIAGPPDAVVIGWVLEDAVEAPALTIHQLKIPTGTPVLVIASVGEWRAANRRRALSSADLRDLFGRMDNLQSQCFALDGEGNAISATAFHWNPHRVGERNLRRVRSTQPCRETLSVCFMAPRQFDDAVFLKALRSVQPIADQVCVALNGPAKMREPAEVETADLVERWGKETGIPVVLVDGTSPRHCFDCGHDHEVGELQPGHRMAGFETARNQSLAPAQGDWVCFAPGTPVRTRAGYKPIEAIVAGDKVLTHKGRYKKVKQLHRSHFKGEMVWATPAYAPEAVGMTPNHPVLATKNFKCFLPGKFCQPHCARQWGGGYNQGVKNGKRKATLSTNCQQGYKDYALTWMPAERLEKGDTVVYQAPVPDRIENLTIDLAEWLDDRSQFVITTGTIKPDNGRGKPIPRHIVATEGFWRLCGYYLSEGCASDDNWVVQFSFHQKETDLHGDVAEQMKALFGQTMRLDRKPGKGIQMACASKVVAQFFRNFLGIGADHKRLPDVARDIPIRHALSVFFGCWRGDGTIHPDSFKVVSNSRTLVYQLRDILMRLEIVAGIRRHDIKRTRAWVLSVGGTGLNRLAAFGMEHPFIEERSRKMSAGYNKSGWTDGYRQYTALRSVTRRHYDGTVYNLGVEDDNSYTAGDMVVHNCWLDTDEQLLEATRLAKYLRPNVFEGYGVNQDHFSSDPPQAFKRDTPVRVFRRKVDGVAGWTTAGAHDWPTYHSGLTARFSGVVHEHPGHKGAGDYAEGLGPVLLLPDLWIAHEGYFTESMRRRRFLRNWPLMVADRQKYPDRRLGQFLWLRDLSHHVRYLLERSGNQLTAEVVWCAEEAVGVFERSFSASVDAFMAEALSYVDVCYRVLGRGYDVQVSVNVKRPEVSGDDAVALTFQGRVGEPGHIEALVKAGLGGCERWSGAWA